MARNGLKWLDNTALILLAIGGLNWGLDALGFNLVTTISNALNLPILSNTVYTLVALSAIWVFSRFLMGRIKVMK